MSQDNNDNKRDPTLIALNLPDFPEDGPVINLVPDNFTAGDVIEEDINYARDNLTAMIAEGKSVMEIMKEIARQSQSTQAYSVYARLFEMTLAANRDLSNLSLERKRLAMEASQGSGAKVIEGESTTFRTSTASILDELEEEDNPNVEE